MRLALRDPVTMGWNMLHQFAMENKVDAIHDDIYKKGTIVRESTELVCFHTLALVSSRLSAGSRLSGAVNEGRPDKEHRAWALVPCANGFGSKADRHITAHGSLALPASISPLASVA